MKDTEKVKEYLIENYPRIDNQNITVIENDLDLSRLNFKSKTKDTVKADFIIKERKDKLFSGVEIEAAVTDNEQIVKYLEKEYEYIKEDEINQVFRVYKRQSEIDYFIHKDAGSFLREQFKLFVYQYLTEDFDTVFDEKKLDLIRKTKRIAYKTIDYIAGFEDELKRIWLKPKFARRSNYVVTLDRIAEKDGIALIEGILKHNGFGEQVKEWKELGIISEDFDAKKIFETNFNREKLNDKFKHLPIDTRYFKDLEIEILGLFDDLDNELDGWLIHSENYQALNTILPKFREKVQMIYIDPPFNTGEDFPYVDKFQDSSWLSLMEDRINSGIKFLRKDGSFWLHLDENSNELGKILAKDIFQEDVSNEIVWDKGFRGTESKNIFQHAHDTVFLFKLSEDSIWNQPTQVYKDPNLGRYNKVDEEGRKYALIKRTRTDGTVYYGKTYPKEEGKSANDVISYIPTMASTNTQRWIDFKTQKPEELLQIFIETSSNRKSIVLDFFGGSGTTIATAHKSDRKWMGIEMDEYFENILLSRMKEVLAGKGNHEPCGISKEVNWQGGGFFKYYSLEQYEETLSNACYRPLPEKIEKIDFRINEKLADRGLKIDYDKEKAYFRFEEIYDDIDIIETISNITGWKIKKVSEDKATYFDELTDSEKEVDLNNLTADEYPFLKPLIWW